MRSGVPFNILGKSTAFRGPLPMDIAPRIGGGAVPINAPFASVNGSGAYDSWSAEYAATPSVPSPIAFTASRQGYDASGNTTTYLDTLYVTTRVRQPYPNQASNSALTVALSDYIYSTDTPSGSVVNNATFISPVPICNWVTPHRSVVGDTIGGTVVPVEIVAFHRNARSGRQVASVVFSITDGTTTITCTPVSSTVVSGRTGDRFPVIVYRMPETTISSLNNNVPIMVRAQVYPWIGASASVADSNNGTAPSGRDFGPRYFYRSTSLNTSPYYAYVKTAANGGNDGTGVFSTTAGTADANPFLTVQGMFNALNSGAAGKADGVIVRIGNDGGTPFTVAGSASARNQDCAAIIITRDPNVARANARVSWGTARLRLGSGGTLDAVPAAGGGTIAQTTGCVRFTDINLVRTAAGGFQGEAANLLEVQFDNCDIDNASYTASWLNLSHDYLYGVTVTNIGGNSVLGTNGTLQHRIFRGVSADLNSFSHTDWLTVGCDFTETNIGAIQTDANGAITAFTRASVISSSNSFRYPGASTDVTGYALVQNVIEWTLGAGGTSLRISADSAGGDNAHIVMHNNTFVGAFEAGRGNLFYDEGATPRTSTLMSCRGNIHVQINTKSDVFQADGTRLGNWAYMYGVGCQGEWSQYIDANSGGLGASFAQAYPGRGSSIGTTALTTTANMLNSNFADYQGATVAVGPAYSAGAGGGSYTLTSSSAPVKGIVETAALSHDLAGTARPTTADTAGAYVAP